MNVPAVSQFEVNADRARRLAEILWALGYAPDPMTGISPFVDDEFRDAHFIFFMTAIDHNTHAAGSRYETIIDGRLVHGSDLMYARAIATAGADPDFFTPARLRDISTADLARVLGTDDGQVPTGLEERADLLRDAARHLLSDYLGDLRHLFAAAECRIQRPEGGGIVARLAPLRAYEDPIGKKTFLLIKLLRRRGRLIVADPEHIRVPVDHVVFTVALRSSLVIAADSVQRDIRSGVCLRPPVLFELRQRTLEAYALVTESAGQSADEFDDLLWAYGRECLRESAPFPEDKIAAIDIPVNQRLGNPAMRQTLVRFMMGLDAGAPVGTSSLPIPVFPPTSYF